MKIFYAADATPNPELLSQIWTYNLYYPLLDLGHEVTIFNYPYGDTFRHLDPAQPASAAFIEEHRPRLEAELIKQVEAAHKKEKIDLFFSYFYSAVCRPEVIRYIRSLGICTANWYCNASYQFHLIKELAPAYDYCFVPEKFRIEDYRRVGANPLYVQEAANPTFYYPHNIHRDHAITFVGQCYGDRPAIIRKLLSHGLDVRVYGPGWKRPSTRSPLRWARRKLGLAAPSDRPVVPDQIAGRPLSDQELVAMYSRSKISLGFSSCGETHQGERIVQIRLRDFEAPMSGAFYMVEHFDELAEFFELGREIVTYQGIEDLAEKCKYYLSHPEERETIRHAGRLRALADHTWQKRFSDAFHRMGLPGEREP